MSKILIIEDDKVISKFLKMALETNHYEVIDTTEGLSGIDKFKNEIPDVVLLDLGLPDIDGMDVLSHIRLASQTPIIIISARGRETEKVAALDAGADDYVTKPFNISELLARVRVALRKRSTVLLEVFEYRGLKIDFNRHQVFIQQEEIHLTPIEFKLLSLLVEYQGKVLTHSFIQSKIWGYDTVDDYQSLRVFMASIRKKIEQDSKNPHYILTELGVGYRFID